MSQQCAGCLHNLIPDDLIIAPRAEDGKVYCSVVCAQMHGVEIDTTTPTRKSARRLLVAEGHKTNVFRVLPQGGEREEEQIEDEL